MGLPAELLQESENYRAFDEGVYPDNWLAYTVFLDMATQWRTTAVTTMKEIRLIRTGLDFSVLEPVMRMRKIKAADREDVFECIKIMERAALGVINQ